MGTYVHIKLRFLRTNNNRRIRHNCTEKKRTASASNPGVATVLVGARASNPTRQAIRSTFLETGNVPNVPIGWSLRESHEFLLLSLPRIGNGNEIYSSQFPNFNQTNITSISAILYVSNFNI